MTNNTQKVDDAVHDAKNDVKDAAHDAKSKVEDAAQAAGADSAK